MKDLLKKLKIDISLANKVLALDINNIMNIANKCENNFILINKYDDVTKLAVCLYIAKYCTLERYEEKDIPIEIFYDTLSDIKIWCENNNNLGLKHSNWIKNHLNVELFKLGRLQFQMYKCNNSTLNYNNLPFNKGDNVLYVHIPQGEPLHYSECVKSLQMAKAFFNKYYPEFEFRFMFSESWLLYSENFMFMSPSSNILQFQSLFDIVYSLPIQSQAIERIFGKKQLFKRHYPENTTLQRQAKHYIMQGNKLGIGIGIIDILDI